MNLEHDTDRFKDVVDNIFESMESSMKDSEVRITPTEISPDKEEFAKQKVLEELETVRQAFIDFQDQVRGLMVFNYMTSSFQQFAEYASNLTEVIENNIDETKLTSESLKKYKSIRKLRAQILANVYNKYKNK